MLLTMQDGPTQSGAHGTGTPQFQGIAGRGARMGGSGRGAARWGPPVAGARRGASVAAFAALIAATQVT